MSELRKRRPEEEVLDEQEQDELIQKYTEINEKFNRNYLIILNVLSGIVMLLMIYYSSLLSIIALIGCIYHINIGNIYVIFTCYFLSFLNIFQIKSHVDYILFLPLLITFTAHLSLKWIGEMSDSLKELDKAKYKYKGA